MSELTPQVGEVRGFLTGLWRIVLYRPVRFGTLDLSAHSRGVAGIAVGVAVLYALTVTSILFANPLRSVSSLKTSVSQTGVVAVPGLLIPGVLCLLGVAFGLLLAGSQRSPWWRRILYLIIVWGALISVAGIAIGLGSSRPLGIASAVLAAVILLHSLVIWTGRTNPTWDALILVLLSSGLLLASYRSLVLQNLIGTESGELITVAFILTQVASLALPLAFLSGVNATAFGVSLVSWSGADIGRRAAGWVVAVVIIVLLGWSWQSVIRECFSDPEALGVLLRQGLGAVVLLLLCGAGWRLAHSGVGQRASSTVDSSPVGVATACIAVALPVAYGITASAFVAAFLGALVASLGTLLPVQVMEPATVLLDVVGTDAFITITRLAVVAGLVIGAAVLVKRGSALLGAIAAVDAVVLATVFWIPLLAPDWMWTPTSIGNLGMVFVTVMAVVWTARRSWNGDRRSFLLVLILLSALIRQADFFALPVGFLIGASAVALLVVGLVWGFLTDGGDTHHDAAGFPRDRRLLTLLGSFLFAITVVAWAVIGKDVGTSSTLSAASAQALLTLGTALIISVATAAASPWLRHRGRPVEQGPGVRSQGVEG